MKKVFGLVAAFEVSDHDPPQAGLPESDEIGPLAQDLDIGGNLHENGPGREVGLRTGRGDIRVRPLHFSFQSFGQPSRVKLLPWR